MTQKPLTSLSSQDTVGQLLSQVPELQTEDNPLDHENVDKAYQLHKIPWTIGLNTNTHMARDLKNVNFGSSTSFIFKGVNIRPDSIWLKIVLPTWDATSTNYVRNIFDSIQQVTISLQNQQVCQYSGDFLNLIYISLQDDEWRTYLSSVGYINSSVATCQANSATSTTYYFPIFISHNFNRMDLMDINYPMIRTKQCELRIDISFRAVSSASPKWVIGALPATPVMSQAECIIYDEKLNETMEQIFQEHPSMTKQTGIARYTEVLPVNTTSYNLKLQLNSKIFAIVVRIYDKAVYDAGDTVNTFYTNALNAINSMKLTMNGLVIYDAREAKVNQYNNIEKFGQFGHLQFLNTNFLIIPLGDSFIQNMHNYYGGLDCKESSNMQLEFTSSTIANQSLWMTDIFEHTIINVEKNQAVIMK